MLLQAFVKTNRCFCLHKYCVKCNVLYIGAPNVQARGAPNYLAPALSVWHYTQGDPSASHVTTASRSVKYNP